MYRTIVVTVPLDHLGDLDRQIAVARKLLEPDGQIVAMTVIEDMPGYVAEYVTIEPKKTEFLRKARTVFEAALKGHPDIEGVVLTGKAGVVLAEQAREIGADLIIACAHRPDIEEYFLGSTAARVARRASCSVHILR